MSSNQNQTDNSEVQESWLWNGVDLQFLEFLFVSNRNFLDEEKTKEADLKFLQEFFKKKILIDD